MHRVTSAAVLADATAQQDVEITEGISEAPSRLSVVLESVESVMCAESEVADDEPLLQLRNPAEDTSGRHADPPGAAVRAEWSRQRVAGTAMQEVVAVLKLAAPVTIQVKVNLRSTLHLFVREPSANTEFRCRPFPSTHTFSASLLLLGIVWVWTSTLQ